MKKELYSTMIIQCFWLFQVRLLSPSTSFTREILLAPNSAHPGEMYLRWMHRECLVLQFSKHFFATHVLCGGRRAEVGEKDISFGGSFSACTGGAVWLWCISCGSLHIGEKLTLTQCVFKALSFLAFFPMHLRWLLRGNLFKTQSKTQKAPWLNGPSLF